MEHGAGTGQYPRWRVIVADRFPIFAHGLRALASSRTQDIEVVATVDSTDTLLDTTATHTADVIILDAQLPPAGGPDVLRRLRADSATTPVLMLSSAEEIHGAPRVLAEGAAGILSKACATEELFSAIRSIAAGDFVLGAAAAAALLHRNGYAASQLSDSEVLLLDLFMAGHTHSEIAKQMLMSESTLKRKFADVQRKLGAKTRVEAVARAARMGLI